MHAASGHIDRQLLIASVVVQMQGQGARRGRHQPGTALSKWRAEVAVQLAAIEVRLRGQHLTLFVTEADIDSAQRCFGRSRQTAHQDAKWQTYALCGQRGTCRRSDRKRLDHQLLRAITHLQRNQLAGNGGHGLALVAQCTDALAATPGLPAIAVEIFAHLQPAQLAVKYGLADLASHWQYRCRAEAQALFAGGHLLAVNRRGGPAQQALALQGEADTAGQLYMTTAHQLRQALLIQLQPVQAFVCEHHQALTINLHLTNFIAEAHADQVGEAGIADGITTQLLAMANKQQLTATAQQGAGDGLLHAILPSVVVPAPNAQVVLTVATHLRGEQRTGVGQRADLATVAAFQHAFEGANAVAVALRVFRPDGAFGMAWQCGKEDSVEAGVDIVATSLGLQVSEFFQAAAGVFLVAGTVTQHGLQAQAVSLHTAVPHLTACAERQHSRGVGIAWVKQVQRRGTVEVAHGRWRRRLQPQL